MDSRWVKDEDKTILTSGQTYDLVKKIAIIEIKQEQGHS